VALATGQTTVLPYTVWMPALDLAHAVTIASPTPGEVVVTTPRIPGLELRLPPGAVIQDHEGRIATQLTITPIPLDRPPFPLPPEVETPVYVTIQPGAGYVTSPSGAGARLVYPNGLGYPAGKPANFYHYDPGERGWWVYGTGAISADGRQMVPAPGAELYEFTGAMGSGAPMPGPPGPPPCPPDGPRCHDGEPVPLATGRFVMEKTDLLVADPLLPIVLTRTYRQGDTYLRAFGIGTTHPYEIFLTQVGTGYQEGNLILPDGGRVHFVRTSPGTGYTDAVFAHTETPTRWHQAQITYVAGQWELRLRDGTVYTFEFVSGVFTGMRDRFGNTLSAVIDNFPLGQRLPRRLTTPTGRWVEFTYDATPRVTQVRDNLGRTVSYAYDASGRLTSVTDAAGGVSQYTYQDTIAHRMQTLRDPRGILYLTNEFDASGRVSRQTQADGTTFQFAYTTDAQGAITQTDVTDPRGIVRRVTLNASGYILTDTAALGQPEQQTTTYERQAGSHLVTAVIDPLGRRTDSTYDTLGNRTSVTRLAGTPQAVTTAYTYDPTYSQVTSVTDPLGHTTTFGYTAQGALTTITDALTHTTTVTPNAQGQPTAITDPLSQTTSFGYTSGDLTSVTTPLGHTTTRFVDGAGRLTDLTDPLGRTTRYDYDALNRLTQVTDPLTGVTQFTYDPNGNLLTVQDARTQTTSYTYDSMDRLATRTDPLGRVETYGYDATGNLTQVTDRKSQVTTFTYDALNRRTQASDANPSTITYTYDAGNRVTQVSDSIGGTVTRTYDGLDRLTQETTPQGGVSYTHDLGSRRATLTVAGQPAVSYMYDNADRLTQLTQGASGVTLGYDNANRRTSLTLPNGIVIESAYDLASRLTGLTYKLGTTTLGTVTYGYDAAGNRTTVGGTWARTGLPQAVASASYNTSNQQTAFGAATMTYDNNGNLATLTDGSGTTSYTWNARNQLTGLSGPGLTATFGYDGLGRRWTKTINAARTDFLYDGLNPVQEGVLPGTVSANVLTGLGLDEFLTRTDVTGTRAFLPDALGSTLALADPTGALTAEYTYEPFGGTAVTGAPGTKSFQYTARENDQTGLYYYRARYYHPTLQRFIAEDPIEFAGGDENLYAYVWNDPVRLADPLGLAVLTEVPPECKPNPGTESKSSDVSGDDTTGFEPAFKAFLCDANNWILPGLGGLKIPGGTTAAAWIARALKGSLLREFPSQLLNKSIDDIRAAAAAGDKIAQKALKLLTGKRFRR
jgi:RHS repeat-associated protein